MFSFHWRSIVIAQMSSQSSARRAWNEAMKATAGASALPPALQQRPQKRRSDRNKKQERRANARKVQLRASDDDGYRAALWADALECVDPNVATADDDDEYDEMEELEGKSKRKRTSKKKSTAGVLPKRFLPRTAASILIEEATRGEEGTAKAFFKAEAKVSFPAPRRKFCPVTGLPGEYVEPKSEIPYATLRALEQIQERPPPWMTLVGSAAYWEAMKSMEDDL